MAGHALTKWSPVGLKLGVGRRHVCGDTILVEWSTDYGDGRVYRNVTIAELRGEEAIRVTDYWGEPFTPPAWRARWRPTWTCPGRASGRPPTPSSRTETPSGSG